MLCVLEKIYLFIFSVVKFFKLKILVPKNVSFKVISIGNLSTGGVGKSVVARFLINNLNGNGAVLLRGYKGSNEKTNKSLIASNGNKLFYSSTVIGDEAFMLGTVLPVPIVVGSDRYKSVKALQNFLYNDIDFVILDDAYQNHKIKKDLEILLLDARNPFDNGHCLPAGRLREKDMSRADVIILTHSDKVDVELVKILLPKTIPVFYGKHKITNILDNHLNKVSSENLLNNRFLVFAGIGSFSGFLDSLKQTGINIVDFIQYEDHHKYLEKDILFIKNKLENKDVSGAITTLKDWAKISELMNSMKIHFPLYCLDIEFDFLTDLERVKFFTFIKDRE